MKLLPVVLALLLAGAAWAAAPTTAIVANDAAMVPLRVFADWFGARVSPMEGNRVTYTKGEYRLVMTIGSVKINLDGEDSEIDVPPIMKDGALYFPLYLLAFDRNLHVAVDEKAGTLTLTHPDVKKPPLVFTADREVRETWKAEEEDMAVDTSGEVSPGFEPGAAPPAPPDGGAADRDETVNRLPSGWMQHRHALGFQLQCPPDWKVSVDGNTIAAIGPAGQGGVMVAPLFLPKAMPAGTFLRQSVKEMAGAFPNAALDAIRQVRHRPDEVAAAVSFSAGGTAARVNLLCSLAGRSGMLYAILGPKATFAEQKPTLLKVLKSFLFIQPTAKVAAKPPTTGAGTSGPAAKLNYVRWVDPVEKAYSLSVPRGWTVTGGLKRNSPLDAYQVVQAVSPDKRIVVKIGDNGQRGFIEPMPGFAEGSLYPLLGNGFPLLVKSLRPGPLFAADYVQETAAGSMKQAAVEQPKQREDLEVKINRVYGQARLPITYVAGDVAFSGFRDNVLNRGYCFAGGIVATNPPAYPGALVAPRIWTIDRLYFYLAPAAQEATALAVLKQMVGTLQVDLNWAAGQSRVAGATSRISTQAQNEISQMISSTYAYRSGVTANAMRVQSNMMLGQTDLRDPATGEIWKVNAGHNRYWKLGTGEIVGTAGQLPPDVNLTPLEEW